MIVMGLCGMTTKFAECTLGVKYRRIMKDGSVKGGAMYYLRDGFRDLGLAPVGAVLAVMFAIFVIGGAFGAGNMFQSNQAFSQFSSTFLGAEAASNGGMKIGFRSHPRNPCGARHHWWNCPDRESHRISGALHVWQLHHRSDDHYSHQSR
jgi:hypothetical protein